MLVAADDKQRSIQILIPIAIVFHRYGFGWKNWDVSWERLCADEALL